MATDPSFYGTTLPNVHQPDIFPSSPMALVGVFTLCLQERFSGVNRDGLPWYWDDDPTPASTEENTPEEPRKIYISSQYTTTSEGRDMQPALLVDRGDTRFMKLWTGHRGHIHTPTRTEVFVAHATTPISILCLARTRGESANLADHVAFFLLATTPLIRKTFSIHDISPPVIASTQVNRRSTSDIESWITPVALEVQTKVMWRTKPLAPVLQGALTRFRLTVENQTAQEDLEIVSNLQRNP